MAKIDTASFNEVRSAANLKEKSATINEDLHRLTIDIPKDMVKQLKTMSLNRGVSMRVIVMGAIDYCLEHHEE